MKTFYQFQEDIEQRRQQLRQRQLDTAAAQREKVASYHAAQKERVQKQKEKEEIKQELRKELQTEQTPVMDLKPFNVMKAREQARGGIAHRRHVHQEIGAEARAQQTAKRARMKAIMSR